MEPGSTTNFNLLSSGNLIIGNGSVTATNFITSSSKSVKEGFSRVDQNEIMAKLDGLEMSKWRYKDSGVKGYHIGPMAEDFYKLFELDPDNKHVVATDLASIALIAAKKLQKESIALKLTNSGLEKKVRHLSADNDSLKERLESLEKLVNKLATSNSETF